MDLKTFPKGGGLIEFEAKESPCLVITSEIHRQKKSLKIRVRSARIQRREFELRKLAVTRPGHLFRLVSSFQGSFPFVFSSFSAHFYGQK